MCASLPRPYQPYLILGPDAPLSARSLDVKIVNAVFPNESVQVTASGMAAPDKGVSIVSYTFGYVAYAADGSGTEVVVATASSPSYSFTGLGVGSFSFFAIGTDSNGASIKVGLQHRRRDMLRRPYLLSSLPVKQLCLLSF